MFISLCFEDQSLTHGVVLLGSQNLPQQRIGVPLKVLEAMVPTPADVVGAGFVPHCGLKPVPDVRWEAVWSPPESETTVRLNAPLTWRRSSP